MCRMCPEIAGQEADYENSDISLWPFENSTEDLPLVKRQVCLTYEGQGELFCSFTIHKGSILHPFFS